MGFEPKEKVTLYLDRSVARSFKAMGKGYQSRINRLLQTWLQMKAAGMIEVEKAMLDRQREVNKAHDAAEAEGVSVPYLRCYAKTPPIEELPEVDW
ncbi:MAG: BrnA antitoxin family protein [Paracoccaceae bacterium]